MPGIFGWIVLSYAGISFIAFLGLISSGITFFSDNDYMNPFEYNTPTVVLWLSLPWTVLTIVLASIFMHDERADEELINSYNLHKYRNVDDFDEFNL